MKAQHRGLRQLIGSVCVLVGACSIQLMFLLGRTTFELAYGSLLLPMGIWFVFSCRNTLRERRHSEETD